MPRNRQVALRYITPASIEIGDLIRASWTVDDLTVTRMGRVAKREYEGSMRVFLTSHGHELFRWTPYHDKEVRVTLIEKAPPPPPPALFDLAHMVTDTVG